MSRICIGADAFLVTIYNPTLDPDGSAGRELTKILAAAFAPERS